MIDIDKEEHRKIMWTEIERSIAEVGTRVRWSELAGVRYGDIPRYASSAQIGLEKALSVAVNLKENGYFIDVYKLCSYYRAIFLSAPKARPEIVGVPRDLM